MAFASRQSVAILVGLVVGRLASSSCAGWTIRPSRSSIGLVIPFAAYLPADRLGVSGVLAAVMAGLVIGRRLGTILTPRSRVMWLTTWKMVAFVLNGFVFVLIGTELPTILAAIAAGQETELFGLIVLIVAAIVVTRFVWVFAVEPAARLAAAGRGADDPAPRDGASRSWSRGPGCAVLCRWQRRSPCRRPSRSGTWSC